jgi:exopolysaccharide production protein ExoZ
VSALANRVASTQSLFSIQYLRGIAAMMVVYHHAHDRLRDVSEALPSTVGEAGVDLFFVVSGFIMVVTTSRQPVGPGMFMLRRIARIVPTYWLYTTVLALFVVLVPGALNLKMTLPHYLFSIFFIPHHNPLDGSIEPVLGPGWTLNYEMFFYCIFAISLLIAAVHRVPILVLMLVGLIAAGYIFVPKEPLLTLCTSPMLLEFAFGALIGHFYAMGRLAQLGRNVGWPMILAGTAFSAISATFILPRPFVDFDTSPLRVATYGVSAVLVVIGALTLESSGTRGKRGALLLFFGLIGDASYALYLTHLFSLGALRIAWLKLGLGTEGLPWAMAFITTGLLVSVIAGMLAYLLLERPATRAAQRKLWHQLTAATA